LKTVFSISSLVAAGLWSAIVPTNAQVNVTQFHNHISRDGLYVDSAFVPARAAGLKRDLKFDGRVIGNVYAQPLYIEGGPGGKAMVIVVTESNYVYSLDALSGGVLWQTNVGPPVPSGVLPCGNITPVGITGTPVVDLASRTLFFNAMIRITAGVQPKHFIFSLNVDNGVLNRGWPVDVNATARSGNTVFNSLAQGQRGALAIVGTNLYVPFGGIAGGLVLGLLEAFGGGLIGSEFKDVAAFLLLLLLLFVRPRGLFARGESERV
jgi:hypothetical protein